MNDDCILTGLFFSLLNEADAGVVAQAMVHPSQNSDRQPLYQRYDSADKSRNES